MGFQTGDFLILFSIFYIPNIPSPPSSPQWQQQPQSPRSRLTTARTRTASITTTTRSRSSTWIWRWPSTACPSPPPADRLPSTKADGGDIRRAVTESISEYPLPEYVLSVNDADAVALCIYAALKFCCEKKCDILKFTDWESEVSFFVKPRFYCAKRDSNS